VIDCGSTVTIIREDMATASDLKITNYSGGKVIGVTGDKLVPIGKAHIKMTIEDSLGQSSCPRGSYCGKRHSNKASGRQ
jgi:hypothetical protein